MTIDRRAAHSAALAIIAAPLLWAAPSLAQGASLSIGTELGPQIGTQKGPSCEVC